jgi:hypothetical protein
VWSAADVGGILARRRIEAAYKRQLAEAADLAALRAEINARIESARGPLGPLNKFQIEEMIDPRDTRRYICEWIANAWRIITQPATLVPAPPPVQAVESKSAIEINCCSKAIIFAISIHTLVGTDRVRHVVLLIH